MTEEPIPRGLEYLHEKYMQHEKIEWHNVQPGTEIVVEAYDRNTENDNFFNVTVTEIQEQQNGLSVATLVVGDTDMWVTEDTAERAILHLPKGTIMQSGISAQFFPDVNATMTYFGGISINRDYSFKNALLPDGRVIDGILIPQVKSVMSFLPDSNFTALNLDDYRSTIRQHLDEALSEHEKAVQELDETIVERALALFSDEQTDIRQEVLSQISTFNPEGRYTLLCLLEHSNDQGVLDKFNDVLKVAMQKEFVYLHPDVRGSDMFPATQRGWRMMVKELGLSL